MLAVDLSRRRLDEAAAARAALPALRIVEGEIDIIALQLGRHLPAAIVDEAGHRGGGSRSLARPRQGREIGEPQHADQKRRRAGADSDLCRFLRQPGLVHGDDPQDQAHRRDQEGDQAEAGDERHQEGDDARHHGRCPQPVRLHDRLRCLHSTLPRQRSARSGPRASPSAACQRLLPSRRGHHHVGPARLDREGVLSDRRTLSLARRQDREPKRYKSKGYCGTYAPKLQRSLVASEENRAAAVSS